MATENQTSAGDRPDSGTRLIWVDLVRTIAVLAVIVLHVSAWPVTQFGKIPVEAWWWANAYDSLVRPCIPLFVMISGAVLLTRKTWDYRYFLVPAFAGADLA